eukprot:TRINITY_DN25328_c0_g1_i1.p1 TRINITY_DN25328_c0_g1~~TRINITY_DN25328_c0_g1_i1.p1  ORF type:complete len:146 (+),score=54.90 TRINITY_DN25328_c0_g1_i1:65-502(+)
MVQCRLTVAALLGLLQAGFAANLQAYLRGQNSLLVEKPINNSWHEDLGDTLHEKHDVDNKEFRHDADGEFGAAGNASNETGKATGNESDVNAAKTPTAGEPGGKPWYKELGMDKLHPEHDVNSSDYINDNRNNPADTAKKVKADR